MHAEVVVWKSPIFVMQQGMIFNDILNLSWILDIPLVVIVPIRKLISI